MHENGAEVVGAQLAIYMETELAYRAVDAVRGMPLTGLNYSSSGLVTVARMW
jgi:hypothetical protein